MYNICIIFPRLYYIINIILLSDILLPQIFTYITSQLRNCGIIDLMR